MLKLKLFFVAGIFSTITLAQNEEQTEKAEETRDFQVTFITPMGTNGVESPNITNKFSLNIIGGVAQGLDGIELGSVANVLLGNMKGFQGSGFTNAVLGNVKGVQLAGYVNYSGGNLNGAALAGLCNVNMHDATGGQFSGFLNANLGDFKGVQLATFSNFNLKNMKGFQGSGFANVNVGNFEGAQIAGFSNITVGNIKGYQVSGFLNYAKKINGLQLGIINVADSVEGAAIGFLSIVKHGLHQIEVSADEVFYSGLSLRTGTRKFYNTLNIGMSPKSKSLLWNIGYGIGTSIKINDKMFSDIILSAHHVSLGEFYTAASELYKLYAGVEFKLWDKCAVAAGPTFNVYLTDTLLPDYKNGYNNIAPYSTFNFTNSNDFNLKGWFGARVAVRFL